MSEVPGNEDGEQPSRPTAAAPHPPSLHGGGHGLPIAVPFLELIKRRNVGRVAILYLVLGYLVLEVFSLFFHLLGMPKWVGQAMVAVVALGFPVALVFAWAYEITPEGLKPSHEVHPDHSIAHHTGRRLDRAIIAMLAVALAYFVADKFWLSKRVTPVAAATAVTAVPALPKVSDKSIAVLPFVDMSEKHDQEYFSDGLSEELIDHLSHVPDLKVIARTSSFAFKGKNEDMRAIAAKLAVANLLEGSVRKAGDELRITAQLIRASDGVHLWSEIYDRKLADIFKIQDEISTTVAKALNAALNATPAVGGQPAVRGTANIEAYNLVLKGNYFYWRGHEGDYDRAILQFQQATILDPHYALPWARMARVYAWQGYSGERDASEAAVKGLDAVERALAIDPNCALAYSARGSILSDVLGNWAAAKANFAKAAALDPNGEGADAAQTNIVLLEAASSGRFDDAIAADRRYLEGNPLATAILSDLAWLEQYAGRLNDSAVTSRKLLEEDSSYPTAQGQYAVTLMYMGNYSEALQAALKETDNATKLGSLSVINWAMGRRGDSDSALGALERGFADRNQYMIAATHAYRGEGDAAFVWLERAEQKRRGSLYYVKVDPLFGTIRSDPRFKALLKRLNLLAPD
jgi:TolB-like protein